MALKTNVESQKWGETIEKDVALCKSIQGDLGEIKDNHLAQQDDDNCYGGEDCYGEECYGNECDSDDDDCEEDEGNADEGEDDTEFPMPMDEESGDEEDDDSYGDEGEDWA